MAKTPPLRPFDEQLRTIIRQSGLSNYRICMNADIPPAQMSRFMNRKGGLSMEALIRLGRAMRLRLTCELDEKGGA